MAGLLEAAGGRIVAGRVQGFDLSDAKVRAALTANGERLELDCVVIAAGAWSGALARQLGSRVPLESERGYNTTLPAPGVRFAREVIFAEDKFVMTPMDVGLRIGGAAEFAGLDAPPDYRRSKALLRLAQRYVPGLDARAGAQWMGHRPSLPDSLPVISRSPRFGNLLYAFGHGHLGLTQAATTGRLIASLAANEPPSIDLEPFRVDRF